MSPLPVRRSGSADSSLCNIPSMIVSCLLPRLFFFFLFLIFPSPLSSPSLPASSNFSLPPGRPCLSEDLSQTCHSPPVHQMPSDFPINPGHSTPAPTCPRSQIVPTCSSTWLSLSHQSFSVQYGSSSPALSLHLFVTLCTSFPAICTGSPVLDSSVSYLLTDFCLLTHLPYPSELVYLSGCLLLPDYTDVKQNNVLIMSFFFFFFKWEKKPCSAFLSASPVLLHCAHISDRWYLRWSCSLQTGRGGKSTHIL